MNMLASRIQFKTRIKGEWMPIYFEPIFMSGERLTIAIAAISETGQAHVFRTLDTRLIKLMYKERADEIIGIINFSLVSLEQFVTENKNLKFWQSPLSGIFKGKITAAEGVEFKHIINQGIQRSSSLSALYTGVELETTDEQAQERISTIVGNNLIQINPRYKKCVNRIIDLGDRERRYNFVDPLYVSNIAIVARGVAFDKALVKILNINDLKHDPSSIYDNFEIILTQAPNKVIDISIANQIKAEAERYNIGCKIIDDKPEKISEYIHEKFRAAA